MMPDWSRRHALHALAAGATAAIAGCSGQESFEGESPSDRSRGTPINDYTVRKVRDTDGNALFWRDERPTDTRQARRGRDYLTASEDVEELTFAPENDAAAELRAFTEATNFETNSISLHSYEVGECHNLRLLQVAREPDGYFTSFCQTLRSPDTACDANTKDTVGFAIRLPFPGDNVTSHGSSWGRQCHERPYPVTPNETEVTDDA